MLGSAIVAMVCLQDAAPTDAQELAKFRDVAAKPEWSMADLMFLGAALQSKFEPVRKAALNFWPDRYPDAWEDFRYLNRYDYEKSDTFWSTVVEPGYKDLLKRQGSKNWVGAVRSLLKFGGEPRPRNLGCGKPGARGTDWVEALRLSRFDSSNFVTKFVMDEDPVVAFNAVERLRGDHPFLKSSALKTWFHSPQNGRLWAAINNYEVENKNQWLSLTSHLLRSRDERIRRAVVYKEFDKLADPDLVLNIVNSLPSYALSDGTFLVFTNFEPRNSRHREYMLRQLHSSRSLDRQLAFLQLTNSRKPTESELLQIARDSEDDVAKFAVQMLREGGFDIPLDVQARMWEQSPSGELDRVTVNTAKPPPDWALKKYIEAIEGGAEGWFLEAEFAEIVSQALPLNTWIRSGQPAKVRTALRMIPVARVNNFAKPILNQILASEKETSDLAISLAGKITFPDDRAVLFEILKQLKGEQMTDLRESLCKLDDPTSRRYLTLWRNSKKREERMFARRTLYFLAHPLNDN